MRILIVDDEKLARATLERPLSESHEVLSARTAEEALKHAQTQVIDLAFVDLQLTDGEVEPSGIPLVEKLHAESPGTIIVVMSGLERPDLIAKCFDLGATDYLAKPIISKTIPLMVAKAKELHRVLRQNQTFKTQIESTNSNGGITTKSPRMKEVLKKAEKLRGHQETVLIRGETGSGKDVLANFLWKQEDDHSRPFIRVNCAAIPATLAESQLFGHRKGAFSGATENRVGFFEAADGGDLFLDEIATLSLEVQAKLLRALENHEIIPVGQTAPKKVRFRLIAATNENLEQMVKDKLFRDDLLARVRGIILTLPPLRERAEDIPALVDHFLKIAGHSDKCLSGEALSFCKTHRWPENIRGLQHAIRAAALFSESNEIAKAEIESQLQSGCVDDSLIEPATLAADSIEGAFNHLASEYEQKLVKAAILKTGNDSAAARFLGIPRGTLRSKKAQWGWA